MSLALVFPGQGAQYVGMGASLAERYPVARDILDEADDALNFALSDVILHGPESELTRTDLSQPAILTVSWMAYRVWQKSLGQVNVAAAAGLSLGEYTALTAAEALTFADALRLVRLRGQAMQAAAEQVPSGMVALIGPDEAKAAALCDSVAEGDTLQVANLNCPGQVVISGTQAACDRAIAAVKEQGKELGIRRAVALPVAGAFHSQLMAPAADRLAQALADTTIADPQIPVYTNVTASPVVRAADIADLLIQQLTSPVRWAESVEAMHAAGLQQFLELGPGKSLSGMIARTVKGVTCHNIDVTEDVAKLAAAQH